MSKGMSYTLEALIAFMLVVVSMMFVFNGLTVPQRTELAIAEENALSCLRQLDADGKLREDAAASSNTRINDNLKDCMRGAFNHTTQVCKTSCTPVTLDRTENIASAEYYVAGHNQTDPALVIVYIWSVI